MIKFRQYFSKNNGHRQSGYALPIVLAVSVIMMTVLVTSLAITSTVRVSMKQQNYSRLTQLAKEAGIAYAQACVAIDSSNADGWSGTNPLTPNTYCDGTKINASLDCTNDADLKNSSCTVLYDDENNYLTSFVVKSAEVNGGQLSSIGISGVIGFVRNTSNGSTGKVWKKYIDDGGYNQITN